MCHRGVQTERFEVTVVFSEAVTGFEQMELSVTGTAGATITDWQPETGGHRLHGNYHRNK